MVQDLFDRQESLLARRVQRYKRLIDSYQQLPDYVRAKLETKCDQLVTSFRISYPGIIQPFDMEYQEYLLRTPVPNGGAQKRCTETAHPTTEPILL